MLGGYGSVSLSRSFLQQAYVTDAYPHPRPFGRPGLYFCSTNHPFLIDDANPQGHGASSMEVTALRQGG